MNPALLDINLYKLPIDNNDQYVFNFPENTKLLIITMEDISDEDSDQLNKIVSATKIADDQKYHLKIKTKLSLAIGKILREQNIQNVISFGVHPYNLGLNIPNVKYFPYKLENVLFIYSDKLEILTKDNAKKSSLWTVMKNNLLNRI